MSIILLVLFIGMAIGVGAWLQKRAGRVPQEDRAGIRAPSFPGWTFAHTGHAWVDVIAHNLVTVGVDEFTKSVFGSVEELTAPEPGSVIQQGGKAWNLKRGSRQLTQVSPISGRVEEVNRELMQNPKALTHEDTQKSWVLKVRPIKLKRELRNLLSGELLRRWNQSVKEQLVASLSPADFPVLQEGGEIKPNLGEELTSQQWEKVAREFFG
jgi:glycine cleavage system H protein